MSNILIGLKKTCLGVLDKGDRDKDNETGLKEGGGIEMSTTPIYAMHALFRFEYLPNLINLFFVASSNSSSSTPSTNEPLEPGVDGGLTT